MIKSEERFVSDGGGYFSPADDPTSPAYLNVWDWDTLRMIKLKGTSKIFPPEEGNEVRILARIADHLSPEVRVIFVDDDGLITGASTDPDEDETVYVPYLPIRTLPSLARCPTIKYSKLQEIDRFGPGVDLSSYEDEFKNRQTVAFKFNPCAKPVHLQMAWNELHLLKGLPPHPNLLRLDRIVLDDAESRVVGFTTKYIPGGNLETRTVLFRFEWLKQLTEVVDFLNLELGIMHQDIAPRNLLIDPDTHKLILFDFDHAAHGEVGLIPGREDVSGVVFTLYELITNDKSCRSIPWWERDIDMLLKMPVWPCNRKLNCHVSIYRNFLKEWVAKRSAGGDMEQYLKAPKQLKWPDLPVPAEYDVPFQAGESSEGEPYMRKGVRTRRVALELGQFCFDWKRPPQSRVVKERENSFH